MPRNRRRDRVPPPPPLPPEQNDGSDYRPSSFDVAYPPGAQATTSRLQVAGPGYLGSALQAFEGRYLTLQPLEEEWNVPRTDLTIVDQIPPEQSEQERTAKQKLIRARLKYYMERVTEITGKLPPTKDLALVGVTDYHEFSTEPVSSRDPRS